MTALEKQQKKISVIIPVYNAEKYIREREDAILLLLYTIRMFDLDKSELNIHNESIRISINKMNRIFYLLKGKMFSMQFPFRIENNDIQNGIRIYDGVTGILINATTLSFLIRYAKT